jgi:TetR/AcrR family transcriptional regulator, regulator of autoinduction and epiphytic fitness
MPTPTTEEAHDAGGGRVDGVTVDGRRLRRERNRETVVEALLAMVDHGNLDPTIAEVAAASGLSARSVFRYFDDVDDLIRSAIQRQQERLAPVLAHQVDPELELSERIRAFVEHRVELIEAMGNVGRVARLRAPIQPLVAGELARLRSVLCDQVRATFAAELGDDATARHRLAAADVACSFEAHEALRRDHGLDRDGAVEAMVTALSSLILGERRAR